MDCDLITRIIFFFISIICISAFLVSCASAHVDPKPQQVIIKGSYDIPDYNRLHSIDIVTHYPLPSNVRKILIQYSPDESHPDDLYQLWQQAIQKTFLRNGFLIVQQDNENNLFKEQNTVPGYDAICIINSFQLTKQTDSISLELVNNTSHYQHQLYYYVASISACIAVDQTIIWQGDVNITSFDLLKNKNIIQEPVLYKTITYDYSYSKKLKQWIKDNPTISITDNFSKYYNNENTHLHKKELIQFAAFNLLNQLKVAQ